jgi:hypothetical protein
MEMKNSSLNVSATTKMELLIMKIMKFHAGNMTVPAEQKIVLLRLKADVNKDFY